MAGKKELDTVVAATTVSVQPEFRPGCPKSWEHCRHLRFSTIDMMTKQVQQENEKQLSGTEVHKQQEWTDELSVGGETVKAPSYGPKTWQQQGQPSHVNTQIQVEVCRQ